MSDTLKYSNCKKPFKWYEQDQQKNDEKILNSQKNLCPPTWNKNRPVVTQIYRTTLEDHANTQVILIDRIIKRLDEIHFNDNYNYNGYGYNSPTHSNVVNVRNNAKKCASFTVHKQNDNKKYKIEDLVKIEPIQKIENSKSSFREISSLEQILNNVDHSKNNLKINYVEEQAVNNSQVQKKIVIPKARSLPPSPKKFLSEKKSPSPKKDVIKLSTIPEAPPLELGKDLVNSNESVPPPPPPPPLLNLDNNVIELKTTSGEESESGRLPNNFLNELLESKKKLKQTTDVKTEDKNDPESGFLAELKVYLSKLKENQGERSEMKILTEKNTTENKKDEINLEEIIKNLKKTTTKTTTQETQTDLSSRTVSSSSYRKTSSSESNKSSKKSNSSKKSSNKNSTISGSSSKSSSRNSSTINEGEFKILGIDNKSLKSSSSTVTPSIQSYRNTDSESSTFEDEKIEFSQDFSKYFEEYTTPRSSLSLSPSKTIQKTLISEEEKSIISVNNPKEDFRLNIFYEEFPQEDTRLPIVYNCQPLETSSRLKNVLIKLYFDLENYNSVTQSQDLDLYVKGPRVSQTNSFNDASFQNAESEIYESQSNNTIGSGEVFFENLRQMIEESQDDTDTDIQRSFLALNEFYNNLLRRFQNRFQNRSNDDVVSTVVSEDADLNENSQTNLSDSSAVNSDRNEFNDVYRSEQKKIKTIPKSGYIVAISEISEEDSSDTIFKPSSSKKKIENESFEKMNTSSGIDERPISKPIKSIRSRSRANSMSQEPMNISTDSEDQIARPSQRKTPTKNFKSRLNSTELDKVYLEEEKKFLTNSNQNLNAETEMRIWGEIVKTEKEINRPKSVPIDEIKKNEKERPKSVVFVEEIKEEKKSEAKEKTEDESRRLRKSSIASIKEEPEPSGISNLLKICSDIKRLEEEKKKEEPEPSGISNLLKICSDIRRMEDERKKEEPSGISNLLKICSDIKKLEAEANKANKENDQKSLAKLWAEINKTEKEKEAKKIEELKKKEERSNLFIIWSEASEASKQRAKMAAYEKINLEQRAYELEKITVSDRESDSSTGSKKSKNKAPPPRPSSFKIEEKSVGEKLASLVSAKKIDEVKNENKKKEPSMVEKLLAQKYDSEKNLKTEEKFEKKIDKDEEKKPKLESLIQKFDPVKRDLLTRTSTVSTTNSDDSPSGLTRIGGLLLTKNVQIDSQKKVEVERPLTQNNENKAFSNQASNLLSKLKTNSLKESEANKKNLLSKNPNDAFKSRESKLTSNIESDTKSLARSENLPQVDQYSRSSLQYQDDSSKRSTIKLSKNESDDSSSYKIGLTTDESSGTESDIEKYFKITKKSREASSKKFIQIQNSNNTELQKKDSDSSDYSIPTNFSILNSNNKRDSIGKNIPKFLADKPEQSRDSFLIDKILLKTSAPNPDDEKFFKDRPQIDSDDSLSLSKKELVDSLTTEKKIPNLKPEISVSDYSSNEEEFETIPVGPTPETMEIFKRLHPSQSANPQLMGMSRMNAELTRENKLSGGKQRKPNEETITDHEPVKRTQSSNSMNSQRHGIFSRLFNKDKSDKLNSKTSPVTSSDQKKKFNKLKK
ncbi:unnamed protein product [Brachionus calyciflorus]|uniref:Uncharacterized protein n=1 Tax=Brachionus calyciflorus TaxID=104777 RepID=A0A813UBY0_9BILA|nr:unnamed protein product [Brachionus calyciflorus]